MKLFSRFTDKKPLDPDVTVYRVEDMHCSHCEAAVVRAVEEVPGVEKYVQGTIQQRTYIAIDLKSFYASVECVDRGLDPLTTNLVVADVSRTEKTICLAVSPSLKASFRLWTYRVFQCHHHCRYRAVGRYHLTHRWLRLNQQEPNLKCFVEFHNFNR